jgi:hypothetical protein
VKGPSELKLQITISPSKSVTELKEAIAAKSDVEKDRQRLIYSGKFDLRGSALIRRLLVQIKSLYGADISQVKF